MITKWIPLLLLVLLWSCGDKEPVDELDLPDDVTFTHLPTDLLGMQEFGAIGQIRVIPKVHGGFLILNPYALTSEIPVYAMSDGVIYNIRKESRTVIDDHAPDEVKGTTYDDFMLEIALTKNARMYYGHVTALSTQILEEAGTLQSGRGVENRVTIHISAGQVLGYIGTHPGFDIGMWDLEQEHYFANPERYSREYRSSVSYTDYLTPQLRNQIWEINPRTVEPRGGKINYDVEGTLSGNWFKPDTKDLTEWSKQLVFARHEKYADRVTIADASPLVDGDGILNDGLESHIWWVVGNSPLPENVMTASGKIKYAVAYWWKFFGESDPDPDGTLLIEMQTNTEIKYQYFEGSSPEEVDDFTAAAKTYVR